MIKKTFEVVAGKTIDDFTSFVSTELNDWMTRSTTDDNDWGVFYFNDYKTKGIEIKKTDLKQLYTCNLNEDGTFKDSIDQLSTAITHYNFYIEENQFMFVTYNINTDEREDYFCLVSKKSSYFIYKNVVYNKIKDFAIAPNPIYSNNFLSLAPFFNIYGDKNQEQGKLFVTYIAPESNYSVNIESKVYSLNGKKYKLINPNLVILWEEN